MSTTLSSIKPEIVSFPFPVHPGETRFHESNRLDSLLCGRQSSNIKNTHEVNKRKSRDAFSRIPEETSVSKNRSWKQHQILRFQIQNFAQLSHPKGSFVETNSIKLGDRCWYLRVYPRGHESSRPDRILVSCFLLFDNISSSDPEKTKGPENDVEFEFYFSIKDWTMIPKRCGLESGSKYGYGFMGHQRRTLLTNGLDENGSLVIDVGLRFFPMSPRIWYPNRKRQKRNEGSVNKMDAMSLPLSSALFQSPEFADITFLIGKRIFHAHRCILALRARMLLELSLPSENKIETDPILIPGIDEKAFAIFLEYVYTSCEQPVLDRLFQDSNGNFGMAVEILKIADKFGCIDLKLFVESVLVDRFLKPSTFVELLLLADALSCALLKEHAIELYKRNPMDVINESAAIESTQQHRPDEGSSWMRLMESPRLLSELLVHVARGKSIPCDYQNCFRKEDSDAIRNSKAREDRSVDDIYTWSVGTLRDRLSEIGFDLDGSREVLINRLKSYANGSELRANN